MNIDKKDEVLVKHVKLLISREIYNVLHFDYYTSSDFRERRIALFQKMHDVTTKHVSWNIRRHLDANVFGAINQRMYAVANTLKIQTYSE